MTGSYSEILERPFLNQGIAEEDEQNEEKEEVSIYSYMWRQFVH